MERRDICGARNVTNGLGSMYGTQELARKNRCYHANLSFTPSLYRRIGSHCLCGYYLCKKNRALSTIIGLGAFSWLVALIRSAILKPIYLLIGSLQPPPIWFIGLSATLAGVFEEGFRYKFLKSFVEERTWFNGIAFGLGAALLEILLIYCIPIIKMAIVGSGSQNFSEMLAGAVERNLVVCIHVGSALLVMHSLRNRWILGIAVSFPFHRGFYCAYPRILFIFDYMAS